MNFWYELMIRTNVMILCLFLGNLTDSKHLKGGVVFIDKLPKTATGKLNRMGLKKLVLTEKIEWIFKLRTWIVKYKII